MYIYIINVLWHVCSILMCENNQKLSLSQICSIRVSPGLRQLLFRGKWRSDLTGRSTERRTWGMGTSCLLTPGGSRPKVGQLLHCNTRPSICCPLPGAMKSNPAVHILDSYDSLNCTPTCSPRSAAETKALFQIVCP